MKIFLPYFLLLSFLLFPNNDVISQRLGSIFQDHLIQNSKPSGFYASKSAPVVYIFPAIGANNSAIYITSPRLLEFTLSVNDSMVYHVMKQTYQDMVVIENVPVGLYTLKAVRKKTWSFREDFNTETVVEVKGEGEFLRWVMPKPRYSVAATALQVGCGLGALAVLSTYGRSR
jgi:hypothetical protein